MLLIRLVLGSLLAFAAAGWAGPVQAIDFIVDDPGSDPDDDNPVDDALCETAGGVCTLRAAIEEANENTGPHTITFDAVPAGHRLVVTYASARFALSGAMTSANVRVSKDY